MMEYPAVVSERDTLEAVLGGQSLARFGDGEFALCIDRACIFQRPAANLRARLRAILHDAGACLVGIPNLSASSPKADLWQRYRSCAELLTADRRYGSAFISRPDSAPWINTVEYWARLESLWLGRDVTLVRGSDTSLTAEDLLGARSVRRVLAPARDAWTVYDDLLSTIGRPDLVLLCLGPTATVLAVDLCARGVHAVDLGHVGMFLRKHRRGEPLVRNEADRASARIALERTTREVVVC